MNDIPVFPDSRPLVQARESRWAPWAFAGVAAIGALLLFNSLETARLARQQPETGVDTQVPPARSLPDLVIPQVSRAFEGSAVVEPTMLEQRAVPLRAIRPVSPGVGGRHVPMGSPLEPAGVGQPASQSSYATAPAPDLPNAPSQADATPARREHSDVRRAGFVARALADPAFIVVQGTVIPAVLETALDSTRPGPVRAQVSRDIRGFDGSHVLIPRGSRLIGQYQSDLSPGQARAMVSWTRLIRPDGVTVDLQAPAIDALGRAGVAGRVNNHTMRRIGDALLQTLVSAGSGFSQRAAPTVVVVPGGTQQASPVMARDPSAIQPTLTVAQGARVSVFVSQDLDFSVVDDPS